MTDNIVETAQPQTDKILSHKERYLNLLKKLDEIIKYEQQMMNNGWADHKSHCKLVYDLCELRKEESNYFREIRLMNKKKSEQKQKPRIKKH